MIFSSLPTQLFHSRNDRRLRKWRLLAQRTRQLEARFEGFSKQDFHAQTERWRCELAGLRGLPDEKLHERLEALAPEAFALACRASRCLYGQTLTLQGEPRVWDMVYHDVQLVGGFAMQQGAIAEMATGEGKTLAATLPAYLMALAGRGVQIVTVNDYLARRDAEWMGHLYGLLGVSVGCLQSDFQIPSRQSAYAKDIVYGTASEFGFDYLRDHSVALYRSDQVQRERFFAIIDEVDSVLIDEARTPLLISGPSPDDSSGAYVAMAPLVRRLVDAQRSQCQALVSEARVMIGAGDEGEGALRLLQVQLAMPKHPALRKMIEDPAIMHLLERTHTALHLDHRRAELAALKEELYFSQEPRHKIVDLSERGCRFLEPDDVDAFSMPGGHHATSELSVKASRIHAVNQLLRAFTLFERDQDYQILDGKVEIIDPEQGRTLLGRRWRDGLHEAMEAKEGVEIQPETRTMATITLQNYFRLYQRLAGMTGTALSEEEEFAQVFGMTVAAIPTNEPCRRVDCRDRVYLTHREKVAAVVEEIKAAHLRKQPVLVGTAHVDISEVVSRYLRREGIPHRVLNAKRPDEEAEIIAMAGQAGAVTVSTNMAGRGTDIRLGEGVAALGGLYVMGTERHHSSRVDLQLRGRSGRQGDAGVTRFFVSLEDDLFKRFGHSDRLMNWLKRMGHREGVALEHSMLDRAVVRAQQQVEQAYSQQRRLLLKYDDVLHAQRTSVYAWRQAILEEPVSELIGDLMDQCHDRETWEVAWKEVEARWQTVDPALREACERRLLLHVLDRHWMEHLEWLDNLREDASLERFAQRDPLLEYRHRASERFALLERGVCEASLDQLCRMRAPQVGAQD